MSLILIGFILILVALLFALPFVGLGTFFPVVGDFADLFISAVLFIVGVTLMLLGGLLFVISEYWWLGVVALLIYVFLLWFKQWVVK